MAEFPFLANSFLGMHNSHAQMVPMINNSAVSNINSITNFSAHAQQFRQLEDIGCEGSAQHSTQNIGYRQTIENRQ